MRVPSQPRDGPSCANLASRHCSGSVRRPVVWCRNTIGENQRGIAEFVIGGERLTLAILCDEPRHLCRGSRASRGSARRGGRNSRHDTGPHPGPQLALQPCFDDQQVSVMTWTRAWLLSLLLLGTGTGGCSAIGVTAPPASSATLPYFECTSDYVLPVVDAAFVAAYAGLAIGNYHLQETNGGAWFVGSPGMTVLLIGAAVPFALSLAYGVHTVSQCRQAKDDLMLRSSRLPAAYPAPGTGQSGVYSVPGG